jgi:hypothetical protein
MLRVRCNRPKPPALPSPAMIVGTREQRRRDFAPLRLMTNEPGLPHDRQVGRLGALEDAAGINANLTKRVGEVGSVAAGRVAAQPG